MSPTAGMKSGMNGFSLWSSSIVWGVYLQGEQNKSMAGKDFQMVRTAKFSSLEIRLISPPWLRLCPRPSSLTVWCTGTILWSQQSQEGARSLQGRKLYKQSAWKSLLITQYTTCSIRLCFQVPFIWLMCKHFLWGIKLPRNVFKQDTWVAVT